MVAVEDVFVLLRALKGPELACLVAILMSPEPVRMSWLKAVTGLSDHTVSDALTILSSLGLAQDDGRRSNWVPAGGFCEAFLKRAEEGLGVGERPVLSPSGLTDGPSYESTDGPPSGPSTGEQNDSERRPAVQQAAVPDNPTEKGARQGGNVEQHPAIRDTVAHSPANRGPGKSSKARKKRRGKRGISNLAELGPPYSETLADDLEKSTPASPKPVTHSPAIRGPAIRGHAIRVSPENRLSLKEEEDLKNLELTSSSGLKVAAKQNASSEPSPPPPELSGATNDATDSGSHNARTHKARTRRILAATQLLFGEMVLGPPERYPDLNLLLGSIAEAYSQRAHLRNPARVVYANLSKGALPSQYFLDDPQAHLPDRFLIAAGLAAPIDASPEDTGWEESVAGLAPEKAPVCRGDASLDLPVGEQPAQGGGRSACEAWKAVRSVLLGDMPLSTYQRYIEPLELLHFEPDGCAFTLQAQDEFSQRWLQDRMQRKLEHMLSGICNRQAQVSIIT